MLHTDSIRNNFVLIYELLDEVLDYGYPQNCSSDVLKMYITQARAVVCMEASQLTAQVARAHKTRSRSLVWCAGRYPQGDSRAAKAGKRHHPGDRCDQLAEGWHKVRSRLSVALLPPSHSMLVQCSVQAQKTMCRAQKSMMPAQTR